MDTYRIEQLPEVRNFLDLGANSGCFSLAVRERFAKARGMAYEPAPQLFEILERNVLANGWNDCIAVTAAAVTGRSVGEVQLRYKAGSPSTSTVVGLGGGEGENGEILTVPAISLAKILASEGAIDLVKMDIEGAEYEVLLNTPVSLLRQIQRLVMEIHPVPGRAPLEIIEHLSAAGLSLSAHGTPIMSIGTLNCPWYGTLMWFGSWGDSPVAQDNQIAKVPAPYRRSTLQQFSA